MSSQDRQDLSSKICERAAVLLQSLPNFPLACYAPTAKEVNIARLFQFRSTCFFPKVDPKTFQMDFFQVNGWSELAPGPYGILEPTTTRKMLAYNEPVILIMPSLALSLSGIRLGYGGGFYDRYLEKHRLNLRVAPIFSDNIELSIPQESFDKPIDYIVTELSTVVLRKNPW